jgi:hypothetical protein
MAAPKFAPAGPLATTYYSSPDVVPPMWMPDRPGVIEGAQPSGRRLGNQGPDQGYALSLAARVVPELHVSPGERVDDAVTGCVAIALRRASLYSRAPIIHDVRLAFTIWGYFDPVPPAELRGVRAKLFEGVGNTNHHYAECRAIADLVPESTLRLTPQQAAAAYPARWGSLTGATHKDDES